MTISKWQELLATLEYAPDFQPSPMAKEDLEDCEKLLNIKLPEDYKTFFQVFGEVNIGDEIFMRSPTKYAIEDSREFTVGILDSYEEQNCSRAEWEIVQKMTQVNETGFNFAGTPSAIDFFFDFSTYSESDKGCDIHLVYYCDAGLEHWEIGRSFYSFIKDYCLGTKFSDDSVPEGIIRFTVPHTLGRI
jgi:hypothetical protein